MNLVSEGKWLLGNHSRSCLVWSFLSYMDTCLIYVYFEVLGYVYSSLHDYCHIPCSPSNNNDLLQCTIKLEQCYNNCNLVKLHVTLIPKLLGSHDIDNLHK